MTKETLETPPPLTRRPLTIKEGINQLNQLAARRNRILQKREVLRGKKNVLLASASLQEGISPYWEIAESTLLLTRKTTKSLARIKTDLGHIPNITFFTQSLKEYDLWGLEAESLSLAKIEEMPTPLDWDEFIALTKFFKISNNPQASTSDIIKDLPFYLYCISVKKNTHQDLARVKDVMTSYFNLFEKLLVDFEISPEIEQNVLSIFSDWPEDRPAIFLTLINQNHLKGRLNSIFVRILQTRKEQSLDKVGWQVLIENFLAASKLVKLKVFTKNSLLQQYERQEFNPEMEEKLTEMIVKSAPDWELTRITKFIEHYEGILAQNLRLKRELAQPEIEQMIDLLNLKPFQDEAEYHFPPKENIFGVKELELILTNLNTAKLLVIHFNEIPELLWVQIDESQKVLGLPVKITADNPNLAILLENLIFSSLLQFLQQKAEEIRVKEKEVVLLKLRVDQPKIPKPKIDFRIPGVLSHSLRTKGPPGPVKVQEKKSPTVGQTSTGEEERRLRKRVVYSARILRQLASERIPESEKVLRQIMRSLEAFQFGFGDIEKLSGRNYFRLRVGDYRVILKPQDNAYYVVNIDTREAASTRKFYYG